MSRIQFSAAVRGTFSKEVMVPIDVFGRPSTNPPSVIDHDNLTLYSFTPDTDALTYKFPIPTDYAGGNIDFAVVWTNDGGVDDNGKAAKWQLDYQTGGDGNAINGSHANSPKSVEDTYDSDSGWIQHRSAYMTIAAADFVGNLCIFLKLSAITPTGAALTCEPHLIGMCFTYTAIWGTK